MRKCRSLCIINFTCKALQKLTQEHFQRKCPELVSKQMVIREQNGIVCFQQPDNYVKHFSRCIENVRIVLPIEEESIEGISLFTTTYIGQNVKKNPGRWSFLEEIIWSIAERGCF